MGRLEETLGYGSRRELAVRFFATFSSLPSLPLAYEVPEGRRMLGRAARSGKRRKKGEGTHSPFYCFSCPWAWLLPDSDPA